MHVMFSAGCMVHIGKQLASEIEASTQTLRQDGLIPLDRQGGGI